MPRVDNTTDFSAPIPPEQSVLADAPPPQDFGTTINAAFQLGNGPLQVYHRMQQPAFSRNPDYPLGDKLKTMGLWDQRGDYVGVQSDEELLYFANQNKERARYKQQLAASGTPGFLAMMAAGLLDPVMLLPFVGEVKSPFQAMVSAGKWAAIAGGLQEAEVQTNQPHTFGEAAGNIAFQTILGAVLGGAHKLITSRQLEEMANPPKFEGEVQQGPIPQAGGAGAPKVYPGGLKPSPGNVLSKVSPITDLLDQRFRPAGVPKSREMQRMAANFSQAGNKTESNVAGIAAAEGGNIEHLSKTYYAQALNFRREADAIFSDYTFGDGGPSWWRNARAQMTNVPGKMSREDFYKAAGAALFSDKPHPVPEIAKIVDLARETVYNPIFEELKKSGIIKDVPNLGKDGGYGNRLWNTTHVIRESSALKKIFAADKNQQLKREFSQRITRTQQAKAGATQQIKDLTADPATVAKVKAEVMAQLQELNDTRPAAVKAAEEQATLIRAQRRIAPEADKPALLGKLRELNKVTGDTVKARSAIKARLTTLDRSRVAMAEKQAKKLDSITRSEEQSVNAIKLVVKRGRKFLDTIDSLSDKEFAAKAAVVRDQFETVARAFDKGEETIVKTAGGDPALAVMQENRAARMTDLAHKFDNISRFDREAWKQAIQGGMDEMVQGVAALNKRRALREAKLAEDASKLDPKLVDEHIKGIQDKVAAKEKALQDAADALHPEEFDPVANKVDFSSYSQDFAEEVVNTLQKMEGKVPTYGALTMIGTKRGPEIARALMIDSQKVMDYLEHDLSHMVRSYMRTVGPDLAITAKFGSPNASEAFADLTREWQDTINNVDKQLGKDGQPISDAEKAQLRANIDKHYKWGRNKLEALLVRAKNMRMVPANPMAASYRLGKSAMELNQLRLGGGFLFASVSDPAGIVMKNGLINTFKEGVVPLITNMQMAKLSIKEAQMGYQAVDMVAHGRAGAVADIWDETYRGTKAEKALTWASNKMGMVNLLDPWTQAWKSVAAVVTNSRILSHIETVMTGKGNVEKAREYLAQVNLTGEYADEIWRQMQGDGANKVNGVWFPNTENWPDQIKRGYRAALSDKIAGTIVEGGLEKPLSADASITGALLWQYKTFAIASTTKILMAGIADHDAAFINGLLVSMGLGAVSYYAYAKALGGDVEKEMQNAGIGKWTDEMLSRSNFTGVLDLVSRPAQKVPGLNHFASFGGTPTTRGRGQSVVGDVMGPSFDILERLNTILTGLHSPTQATLHAARVLMPWQNAFGLRQILDRMEQGSGLPTQRKP